MAIANMDQLVAAMTSSSAQNWPIQKSAQTSEGAGTYFDLFYTTGFPGAGSSPAAASAGGTSYTRLTEGALPFDAPSGGASTYLAAINIACTQSGNFYVVDRLWACSGLATGAGATTTVTGMSSITRYNSGVGCEIWYVCLTAPSAQTANMTLTVSYTNSDGVSGRSGTVVLSGGFPPPTAGQCYPFSLQAGDKGIQSVQTVTNTSGSFTGGTHGLLVARRLVSLPISTGVAGMAIDGLQSGLQQIETDACLNFIELCSSTNTGFMIGNIILIQG